MRNRLAHSFYHEGCRPDVSMSRSSLLPLMSRLHCCLKIAMLFASAVVRSAAPFGGRVSLAGGSNALAGRLVMLSRCRAMVRCRNGPTDQPLDIAKKRQFLCVTERDRRTSCTGARGAANTVHIGFWHVRQIKIHDMANTVDIDPTCGNIGGN